MSTITDDLRRHALELATLREEATARDAAVKAARAAFEQTIAPQTQANEALKRNVAAKESEVRALALVAHEQTQDAKPCAGISIVTLTEYFIDDADVIAHVKVNAGVFPGLVQETLNVSAVKKLAAAGMLLPGVRSTAFYGVRIASDLLGALAMQEAA